MQTITRIRLSLALSATIVGTPAMAQTLFTRSDTTPNYANYHHFEECVAIAERLTDQAEGKIFFDTVPADPWRRKSPYPAHAVAEATRCMQRFNVDTLDIGTLVKKRGRVRYIATALLIANRDADVQRLFQRVLDSLPMDSLPGVRVRWRFLIDMASVYDSARPIRGAAAKDALERALSLASRVSKKALLGTQMRLVEVNRRLDDTASAQQAVASILQFFDSIPPRDRVLMFGKVDLQVLAGLLYWSTQAEGYDSLSRSNAAYRRYLAHTVFQRVYGDSTEITRSLIAQKAKPFSRNFIAQYQSERRQESGDSNLLHYVKLPQESWTPGIVPGKTNLVAFLGDACYGIQSGRGDKRLGRSNGSVRGCWRTVSGLRRLQERFPQVQLTVVTGTFGSIGSAPPLEPALEADTLARLYLGYHRLVGSLMVSQTGYFRIPGIDNRRIDQPEDWKGLEGDFGRIIGVDRAGEVFFEGSLSGYMGEQELREKLEIVFKRDFPGTNLVTAPTARERRESQGDVRSRQ